MKRSGFFKKRRLLELSLAGLIVCSVAVYFRHQPTVPQPEAELSETGVAFTKLLMENAVEGMRRPLDPQHIQKSGLKGELFACDRFLIERPDDVDLLYERGRLHYQLGNVEAAVEDLSRILELQPDNSEVRLRRAYLRHELGSTHAAIADLDEIVDSDPDCSPEVYNSRAYYRAKLGEFEQALPDILRSVKDEPTANSLDTLGYVYMGLSRFSEAKEAYTRGLEMSPDFPDMLYGRAAAYHQLGEDALSRADMAHLRKLAPDFCLHWSSDPDPGAHGDDDKSVFEKSDSL